MENIEDKRIAVLLSGGVDSSVVVYELARQGLHPDCFYIKIGPEEQEEWDCNSEEDMEMATVVAQRYGCRLEVVDCHREYWDQVTRYTMEKVRAGFTPNPDVMCNRLIKFGAFDEKRGHDYDLIATGHYAQTEWIDGRKWLTTSPDPVKDQTDFLAQIHPWQLKKAFFPIGHYMKDEVRQVAEREHLINARRKDSQGICFLGNIDTTSMCAAISASSPEISSSKRRGALSDSTRVCGFIPSDSGRASDWGADRGLSSARTWSRTSSTSPTATTRRRPISATSLSTTSTS